MVAEKYTLSNTNNTKEFLTLMLDLYTAYEADPIMLANAIKNLCQSFGPISKVSILYKQTKNVDNLILVLLSKYFI